MRLTTRKRLMVMRVYLTPTTKNLHERSLYSWFVPSICARDQYLPIKKLNDTFVTFQVWIGPDCKVMRKAKVSVYASLSLDMSSAASFPAWFLLRSSDEA